MDRLRKDIINIFKSEGLSITIEINLDETDFLDVSLNLTSNKYFPFRKPNNEPSYINVNSNHPETIIRDLPQMINKRLSDLSCNQEEFDKAKNMYEKALRNSGFKSNLHYEKQQRTRKNRNRKITWFNPPFNKNVRTNIGKIFIKLIKKHFPKHHKLHKIFNSNTIKLSYSCTTNMKNIIKQHNAKLLKKETEEEVKLCNCKNKENCPLNGKCQIKNIVYKASVTSDEDQKLYYGTSEGEFKSRFNNHTKSFRNRRYINDTELSKHVWYLKDNNIDFHIDWEIAIPTAPYKCGTRRCDLCLTEKIIIIRSDPLILLNKRTELISKCRHRNKFKIGKLK